MFAIRTLLIALVVLTSVGCMPRYRPLASHSLAAGENRDQDVVWITEEGEIVRRCMNTNQGPVCTEAAMQ